MGINDLLTFENDENESDENKVAVTEQPPVVVSQPSEPTTTPLSVYDHEVEDEDDVYYEDDYDDEPEAISAIVTFSIHIDPETITEKDVPNSEKNQMKRFLEIGTQGDVEITGSAPNVENSTWDVTLHVSNGNNLEMLAYLSDPRNEGETRISPYITEDGDIGGEMVRTTASAEIIYG